MNDSIVHEANANGKECNFLFNDVENFIFTGSVRDDYLQLCHQFQFVPHPGLIFTSYLIEDEEFVTVEIKGYKIDYATVRALSAALITSTNVKSVK